MDITLTDFVTTGLVFISAEFAFNHKYGNRITVAFIGLVFMSLFTILMGAELIILHKNIVLFFVYIMGFTALVATFWGLISGKKFATYLLGYLVVVMWLLTIFAIK